jgi:nitrite reductase/ring-hydroxylating ferredoxin subunit
MDNLSPITNLTTPESGAFPRFPQSWYFVCTTKALPPGSVLAVRLCERSLVVFRTAGAQIGALAARCPHLGSDLSLGQVVGDTVECPYHRFRFGRTGECREQGLQTTAYPIEERFGAIFVFLGAAPLFPLPQFADAVDLVSAEPAQWDLDTQWYMVGANAFDARHFAHAHDRHLVSPPVLSTPHRYALHIHYRYEIAGTTWIDRATRFVSGSTVEFDVTAWGGNMALVTARFERDRSFGVVIVEPRYLPSSTSTRGVRVTVIVNAARRGHSIGALIVDRIIVGAKRFAIRRMLIDDAKGIKQLDYVHSGLKAGDESLASYLGWVADLPAANNLAPRQSINKGDGDYANE